MDVPTTVAGVQYPERPPSKPPHKAACWRDLASASIDPNPFYHPALLLPALDHLTEGASVRVLEARDDTGVPVALLPVVARSRHGSYTVRNTANWMHDQCFYGAPLMRSGHEEQAWAELLRQLDEAAWAGDFLHLGGLDIDGPAATALRRCCDKTGRAIRIIASHERAMLRSDLDPDAYWRAHAGTKRRKELRRVASRLAETGRVEHRTFEESDDVRCWIEDFLALERSGWKGKNGTALDSHAGTRDWFRDAILRAAGDGMIEMLRIDLNGAAIAMLVNLRVGRAGFSYKIAFDERFARYSPGVLVELDNLAQALADPDLDWMDSCAAPDHPMIDGIWAERRRIGQFRVALKGHGARAIRRRIAYAATGLAEDIVRALKRKRR